MTDRDNAGAPRRRRLAARRAVEALRSGVPSRDAVAALGSGQADIEDRFGDAARRRSVRVRNGRAGCCSAAGSARARATCWSTWPTSRWTGASPVSRVVVSKETPLHDPAKVLRAAVESAVSPDGAVGAVAEAAAGLDPDSPGYAELLRWATASAAPVDERFPATLSLFPRVLGGEDDVRRRHRAVLVRRPARRRRAAPARQWAGSGRPALPRCRLGSWPASGSGSSPGCSPPPGASRLGDAVRRGRADRPLHAAAARPLLRRARPLDAP